MTVYSDHKPLASIVKKPLDRAPKLLKGMLMRALAYDIEVRYLNGKEMYLADTLSRAHLPRRTSDCGQEEFETINTLSYLIMPEEKIHEIRQHTSGDTSLQQLKRIIQEGWPADKKSLQPLVTPYFSVRDELAVTDGLIFRGERLVIPKGMRAAVKKDIHSGHKGIEACLRRAREHVYWPGMNEELKAWIRTCETCRENELTPCKETLMSHEIPEGAWEKIGADLFTYHDKEYLVTVCYKSNFSELDPLTNTKSSTVIKKLKSHLARYGIPRQLVTDNGPQFTSSEFKSFTKKWGIEHTTTSPYHSKANGKVESAVKTAKRMLRKTSKSGEDQYLALLNIRNTPTQGVASSPAQRLLGRRTRSLLPSTRSLLEPRNPPNLYEMEQLQLNQKRQQCYYNRSAHDLPALNVGDTVRMKPFVLGKHDWDKGKVTKRLDERSYEIQSHRSTYRRNRQHLVKSPPVPVPDTLPAPDPLPGPQQSPDTGLLNTQAANSQKGHLEAKSTKQSSPVRTRSGRVIKEPVRFQDYVKT